MRTCAPRVRPLVGLGFRAEFSLMSSSALLSARACGVNASTLPSPKPTHERRRRGRLRVGPEARRLELRRHALGGARAAAPLRGPVAACGAGAVDVRPGKRSEKLELARIASMQTHMIAAAGCCSRRQSSVLLLTRRRRPLCPCSMPRACRPCACRSSWTAPASASSEACQVGGGPGNAPLP